MSDDPVKALDSASRAVPAAMASGDAFACVHAVLWEANAVDFPASWP